jgi:hypothetical protein
MKCVILDVAVAGHIKVHVFQARVYTGSDAEQVKQHNFDK